MADRIQNWIYSKKDEMLSVLGELISIPSVMGEPIEGAPFGEEPKRALLKMQDTCEKFGFKTHNIENAVLCADYLPNGESAELGILAHLDVVPVEPRNWSTNPFTMIEKNGVLFGRGTIDDKGPAVAALYALRCVKELGIPLTKGVRLIFGTNEENGSEDLEIYKKHDKFPPKVFTPDGSFPIINIEKGMMRSRFAGKTKNGQVIEFHGGKIPNAVPDRAEVILCGVSLENVNAAISACRTGAKFEARTAYFHTILGCHISDGRPGAKFEAQQLSDSVKIVAKGRSAHASTPETGINAVTALISLVNRLCDEPVLQGLERIFPFGETDGSSLGLKSSDESGGLTCVFSILDISDGEINGTVDVRFPTCQNLVSVEAREREAFASAGLDFGGFMGDEPHVVSESDDFVQALLRVYERVEGEKGYCVAIGGGTYVHDIEGGVAFGAERGDTDYHMHGDNEFITVDELLKDTVLFANAILEICK